MTPQQRSVELLRAEGWTVEIVERISRVRGRTWRNDLWGWADLLAIHPDGLVLAVQVTSASNIAARRSKIAESDLTPLVRKCAIGIELHGWRKASSTGRWVVKREDLS